jgi:UDP-2-acetamido-3-amino-2,3-dideoxy-glucuronate N-acetyltransferase
VQKDGGQRIALATSEPLKLECEHFLECVASRRQPRTDAQEGVRVLQVLEACEHSLRASGRAIELQTTVPAYFAHPTAVIDPGSVIGRDTKIWHFSHIMSGARIGNDCNIGQNVVISPGVTIGKNVKIQNNVSVYTGVELEDDVFCGPSMVFTNVINPRSHIVRKNEYRRTLVKRGASIGANATVVCGVTLGSYSFVGAGAVVTNDVPDYALVVGVPAAQTGWMCYCGVKLVESLGNAQCKACGRIYRLEGVTCTPVAEIEKPRLVATPTEPNIESSTAA